MPLLSSVGKLRRGDVGIAGQSQGNVPRPPTATQTMISRDIFGVSPGEILPAGPHGGPLFATESLFLPAFGFARHESGYRLVLDPGPWQQVGTATR